MRYILSIIFCLWLTPIFSQSKKISGISEKPDQKDSVFFSKLHYRLIGPWRGGRSAAVAASYKNRNTFYFGATGGGVWKTTDAGSNWKNISDKYFGSSIGAVAVAPSDETILYAAEGENTMRGNVSEGLGGVWKSEDAGRSWKNIGLRDGRHIIRLVIHPKNPDIVWAAVMGHLFGPNEERGVFKTIDGGRSWKRVLYVNNQTGVSDLVMESGNPKTLYAGTWRVIRTPYSLESGGEGSGLWKSIDGGDSWMNITGNKGLPKDLWGIVGVAVAPSNPEKLYALIENAKGGLYMSVDAGQTWTLQSSDNNIRQRAWYYTKVFVDPKNENIVYAPNVGLMRSRDGGKTWQSIRTPHGDHHDLWIDPEDANRMVVADDGGAQVSFDAGDNWSTYMNQPTAQIYRVSTDNSFPYRVLGAQQDNSTFRIKSRTYGGEINDRDWEPTAGSESGYVVADPQNPDIVYGGNYGGYLSRLDHKTGENRAITVWPDNPMGAGAASLKYRFQWNFPIFFSPHNPKRLYAAGNALFVTENEGQSWDQISPDLTTNDKTKQGSSGGPITKDNTSVEYYCTIFAAAESPYEKDLLWTGSDDGLIHVSRNGGTNWENVTPANAPKWIMWNSIEPDPSKKGSAYFVGTRYKSDDFTPFIYKTDNYGKTWKLLTNGIDKKHFTRVLRADPKRAGLLYAGTEYGMYISFDEGINWKKFQLNLPEVPITDLAIKNNDLVVATQGRSLYILDDLSVLQQINPEIQNKNLHVFNIHPAYRMEGSRITTPVNAGMNPANGVKVNYYLRELNEKDTVDITILDNKNKVIKSFSTAGTGDTGKIDVVKGMNQFVWDLQYAPAERIEGMILWNGVPATIKAIPGTYSIRVKKGNDSAIVKSEIVADPNYKVSPQEYDAQFAFLSQVRDKFNEIQKNIKKIRETRIQINDFISRQGKNIPLEVKKLGDTINKQMTGIEENLYQTKARSGQDVLNYPIKLNDKLSGVFDAANSGYFTPSKQVKDVYAELTLLIDAELQQLNKIFTVEIPKFNQLVREKALPVISGYER